MPPERTLIRASHIIAFDGRQHRYLKDGVVVYEGDTIIHVGKKFDGTIDHLIDATNKVVTPGFIDTHIHMAARRSTSRSSKTTASATSTTAACSRCCPRARLLSHVGAGRRSWEGNPTKRCR